MSIKNAVVKEQIKNFQRCVKTDILMVKISPVSKFSKKVIKYVNCSNTEKKWPKNYANSTEKYKNVAA